MLPPPPDSRRHQHDKGRRDWLDKGKHEETQAQPHTKPFDVTGKVMKGWALIKPAGIEDDGDLKEWVRQAAKFAATLPPK